MGKRKGGEEVNLVDCSSKKFQKWGQDSPVGLLPRLFRIFCYGFQPWRCRSQLLISCPLFFWNLVLHNITKQCQEILKTPDIYDISDQVILVLTIKYCLFEAASAKVL